MSEHDLMNEKFEEMLESMMSVLSKALVLVNGVRQHRDAEDFLPSHGMQFALLGGFADTLEVGIRLAAGLVLDAEIRFVDDLPQADMADLVEELISEILDPNDPDSGMEVVE